MKHILKVFSTVRQLEIEISEKEFIELKEAKEFLHYIANLEESYDIVISNYTEFEQEI